MLGGKKEISALVTSIENRPTEGEVVQWVVERFS